jgi:hypothetical protein
VPLGNIGGSNKLGGYDILPDGAVVSSSSSGARAAQDCPGGGSTVITGTVLDPAGKNLLWNVTVFVADPNAPLPDLEKAGLQCGCSNLYPSDVLAYAQTDTNGAFTIHDAPSGSNTSLVVQIGKWRRVYGGLTIHACETNTVPALALPQDSTQGDLPDIAISTGGADSLECLPYRMGVSASEYVGGSGGTGHIHIFHGYDGANTAPPAPESYAGLWGSTADLEDHDIVLLSCEGHETTGGGEGYSGGSAMTNAYQQSLMDYANAGGRVFASHYHYAWFTQPPTEVAPVAFAAANIATWQGSNNASEAIDDKAQFASDVDTSLSSGAAFPEGQAMQTWLGNVGALTKELLPIQYARMNVVSLTKPAVEWIHLDSSVTASAVTTKSTTFVANAPQYFSVDTPISSPSACGRVVYSDLHVSGGPGESVGSLPADYPTAAPQGGGTAVAGVVPSGCAMHDLSPQEKALEFMLFDLSSCLVPIGSSAPPPPNVTAPK